MATILVKGLDLVDSEVERVSFETELAHVFDHNVTRSMSEIAKSLKKALKKNPNLRITMVVR